MNPFADLIDHEGVELMNETGIFERCYELRRFEQAASGIVKMRERLVSAQTSAGDMNDRLIQDFKSSELEHLVESLQ